MPGAHRRGEARMAEGQERQPPGSDLWSVQQIDTRSRLQRLWYGAREPRLASPVSQ